MSKKSKADLGPLGFLIDLGSAAVMRSVTKKQIIKDYKRGKGNESVATATAVLAHQAMRKGSDGLIGLGGLYGVNSAVKEIERQKAAAASARDAQDSIPVYSAPVNDNSDAWRLNTEEGKLYGLNPNDYATREKYLSALTEVKSFENSQGNISQTLEANGNDFLQPGEIHVYCKVSLLNSGKNRYFLADKINVSVGNTVKVKDGGEIVTGVVLTVEQHSSVTAPLDPEETSQIISLV